MASEIKPEEHIGLVKTILKSFQIPHYLYDDAFCEACYALVVAAQKYDSTRKTKFSTFAWIVIRNYIIKMLETERTIRGAEYPIDTASINNNSESTRSFKEYIPFNLSDRDKYLLNLYYLDRYTTKEIGQLRNTTGKYEMQKIKDITKNICKINQEY